MRPSTANKIKGNSPNSKLTQENDIYTYTNLKKILFRPKRPQSSKKLNKSIDFSKLKKVSKNKLKSHEFTNQSQNVSDLDNKSFDMSSAKEFESYIENFHPFKKEKTQACSNIKNDNEYDKDLNQTNPPYYNLGNAKDFILFKRLKKNKQQYEDKLNSSNEQIIAKNHIMLPKYGKHLNPNTNKTDNKNLLQNNYINQKYYPTNDLLTKRTTKKNSNFEVKKPKKNTLILDPKTTNYEPMELIYLRQNTQNNEKPSNYPLIVFKPKENFRYDAKSIKQVCCPNRSFDQCFNFVTKKPRKTSKISPYAYIHKNLKESSPSPSKNFNNKTNLR